MKNRSERKSNKQQKKRKGNKINFTTTISSSLKQINQANGEELLKEVDMNKNKTKNYWK